MKKIFSLRFMLCLLLLLLCLNARYFNEICLAAENNDSSSQNTYVEPGYLKNISNTGEVILKVKEEFKKNQNLFNDQLSICLKKLLNNPEKFNVDFSKTHFKNIENCETVDYDFINIHLSNAIFDNLRIDTASIMFNKTSIDIYKLFKEGKIRVIAQDEIYTKIVLLEKDLNDYLIKKSEKIKVQKPYAKLENKVMKIGGVFRYGIMVIDFNASGDFKVVDGSKIHFNVKNLNINRMKVPRNLRRQVENLNPILDLQKFPFKLILKSIEVENNTLIFAS